MSFSLTKTVKNEKITNSLMKTKIQKMMKTKTKRKRDNRKIKTEKSKTKMAKLVDKSASLNVQ